MSFFRGPKIITNGLILYLDAANTKSFRGEPTTNTISHPVNISNWSKQETTVGSSPAFYREIDGKIIPFYKVTSTSLTDPFIYTISSPGNISNRTFTYTVYLCTDSNQPSTNIVLFTYGSSPSFEGSSVTSQTITITSDPKRYTLVSTYGAGFNSTVLTHRVDLNQSTLGYLYVGGAQVEEKSYSTHFIDGTRGSTVATGGGLIDLSSNANNGALVSGVTYNSEKYGSLYFDGVDDHVLTTLSTFGNNMTWEAWVYCEGNVSTYNMFMGRALPYFSFFGGNSLYFSNNISGVQRTIQTATNLSYNTWYHALFTTSYDGANTTMKIYTNGAETATGTWAGSQENYGGSYKIMLGDGNGFNDGTSPWYPFKGRVSNVKVYNRTLTTNEITNNYNTLKSRFGL